MTRYVLDTNIISEVIKPEPSQALVVWLEAQSDDDLHLASFTVAEIKRGILEKPRGRKRDALDAWFDGPQGPLALFAGRVLPFDARAALRWAELMADGKKRGRPRSPLDMIIASIADTSGCVVVTANEKDFAGVKALNPMKASAGS